MVLKTGNKTPEIFRKLQNIDFVCPVPSFHMNNASLKYLKNVQYSLKFGQNVSKDPSTKLKIAHNCKIYVKSKYSDTFVKLSFWKLSVVLSKYHIMLSFVGKIAIWTGYDFLKITDFKNSKISESEHIFLEDLMFHIDEK